MLLAPSMLGGINTHLVSVPRPQLLQLPEKVLQFGTGVLLRGLPCYYIDNANRQGLFNGRVVVVKSTPLGDTLAFGQQAGLYTLCTRGVAGAESFMENRVVAAISRVVHAATQWAEILRLARSPQLEVIISNTTETGIQLVHEPIGSEPPASFPGKLLAVLLERYRALGGDAAPGLVILPTELLPDNANQLKTIVLALAAFNQLDSACIRWLQCSHHWCNTLVDRIVPGRPDEATLQQLHAELGYTDNLLIMAEAYNLWAIEGGAEVAQRLSFAAANPGVIITPDINRFRELKLRLLNGTHTLSCGIAFLYGCTTVRDAMNDPLLAAYIARLMEHELAPALPFPIGLEDALAYGATVLDRFRNPAIRHPWLSITLQYSSKLKLRVVPLLLRHYEKRAELPRFMALGFAAYLCFTHPAAERLGTYTGHSATGVYPIQDDQAGKLLAYWQLNNTAATVRRVLSDTALWGTDLSALPGFAQSVLDNVNRIQQAGMRTAVQELLQASGAAHTAHTTSV